MCKPKLERLKRHLELIARERNFETAPQTLREIRSYIKEEWASYGLRAGEEPFTSSGMKFANLTARLPEDPVLPRFIIGAHFDAVPGSPGADDNATGVAALLEAARLYTEYRRANPAVSACVEFAAFDLEEYGMVGSQAYVRKLKREGVQVAGMLSLEMVGYTSREKGSQKMPFFLKPFYPDTGNFIGLVANTHSGGWLKRVKKIFEEIDGLPVESLILPLNGWVFPDARLSDHSSFWDEGYPALLVTDTSFFRNPHYHLPEDRIETLDLDFLMKVTEAVFRVTRQASCK